MASLQYAMGQGKSALRSDLEIWDVGGETKYPPGDSQANYLESGKWNTTPKGN